MYIINLNQFGRFHNMNSDGVDPDKMPPPLPSYTEALLGKGGNLTYSVYRVYV